MALVNLHTLPGLSKASGVGGFVDFPKFPEFPEFGDVSSPARSTETVGGPGNTFADILSEAIHSVSAQEHVADQLAVKAATGADVDPHTMMIETAKAETMVHLTSSISTKMAQNVQTIMNMQI